MHKAKRVFLSIVLWIVVIPLNSFAQQHGTVGELLDKGGRRLATEELKQLVSGATVSGVQSREFPFTTFEVNYKSDGTGSGRAFNSQRGTRLTVEGPWLVDEQGEALQGLRE